MPPSPSARASGCLAYDPKAANDTHIPYPRGQPPPDQHHVRARHRTPPASPDRAATRSDDDVPTEVLELVTSGLSRDDLDIAEVDFYDALVAKLDEHRNRSSRV